MKNKLVLLSHYPVALINFQNMIQMYYVLYSIFRGNIGLESIQFIELFMLKVIREGLFGSISHSAG